MIHVRLMLAITDSTFSRWRGWRRQREFSRSAARFPIGSHSLWSTASLGVWERMDARRVRVRHDGILPDWCARFESPPPACGKPEFETVAQRSAICRSPSVCPSPNQFCVSQRACDEPIPGVLRRDRPAIWEAVAIAAAVKIVAGIHRAALNRRRASSDYRCGPEQQAKPLRAWRRWIPHWLERSIPGPDGKDAACVWQATEPVILSPVAKIGPPAFGGGSMQHNECKMLILALMVPGA